MDTLLLLKNLTAVAKSCLVIQHKRQPPPPPPPPLLILGLGVSLDFSRTSNSFKA